MGLYSMDYDIRVILRYGYSDCGMRYEFTPKFLSLTTLIPSDGEGVN